ncbi:MAG: hypothetical protein DRO90_00425 [Candidatus Altiarchaeales archaeon]|nr:MAG: hypothetical protein DRO90_00425 [Candidatus Altiarchaeales archaeon]
MLIATILFLILMTLSLGVPRETTRYFDVTISQDKEVFRPGDVMRIRIIVRNKTTHDLVNDADVYANIRIYQGNIKEKINVSIDEDEFYEAEERIIARNIRNVKAKMLRDGAYVIERNIETEAAFGGITLQIFIKRDGNVDVIERVVTFIDFNPLAYAIIITFLSAIFGLIIGFIFGEFHR